MHQNSYIDFMRIFAFPGLITVYACYLCSFPFKKVKAVRQAIDANDAIVLQYALAKLTQPHLAYVLPSLFRQTREKISESIRLVLLDFARNALPLEEQFSDVGYQSSQPNWQLEIACALYLWAMMFGLSWGVNLMLVGYISSSGVWLLMQILVVSPFAVVVGVLMIKRLSEARYHLSSEGIEFMPIFRKRFFVPWKSVSAVRLIGYREYELSWNTRSVRIRNTFNENSYLPHLILSHVGETATLDEHFILRRELWFNTTNS